MSRGRPRAGRGGRYRPYNDRNPIIDTTTPPDPRRQYDPKDRRNTRRVAESLSEPEFNEWLAGRRLRQALIQRLTLELMVEQSDECYWCGTVMWHPHRETRLPEQERDDDSRATFDHKVPVSRGGADTKENGVAACRNCNMHRGTTPFEEYEKWPPEGYTP